MIAVALFVLYLIPFLFGIVIGSFLNVCILRIPLRESVAKERSHCMTCGHQLAWYDLFPLFSWLALGGRCRYCKAPISPQYPIIEGVNGILYVLICLVCGFTPTAILYCLMASALLALSVIDWRTYEIPIGFNLFIGVLGVLQILMDREHWSDYLIGFFAVSSVIFLIWLVSRGRAIGDGDYKLMAACGLLLGWKLIILAFFLGCILGSVFHILRMKVSGAEHVLAMGPYLSLGVMISALWGQSMIHWYLGILGL